jgi:hypothetical protein
VKKVPWQIIRMAILVALVVMGLFLFVYVSFWMRESASKPVRFGVTYSTVYAWHLGLDVIKTYEDLVEELGVRAVRLPVYWPDIEPDQDRFDWNQLDQLVAYSEQKHVKLTLVIGQKVPRWPECFIPNWAQKLSKKERQQETEDMIKTVVMRYRSSTALERWQVENEPFLPFGVCEQIQKEDLKKEIDLVRSLDSHPIQVTASGELGPWGPTAAFGDGIGISVYRKTWNNVFGYLTYPLSPFMYRLRTWPIQWSGKQVLVSELQAEPWFSEDIRERSVDDWYHVFSAKDFAENIQFVKEMHVPEVYLWGAEWWVYLKQHREDRLWNEAKKLFQP